jgi:hypothetical protein
VLQLGVHRDSDWIYREIANSGPGVEPPDKVFEAPQRGMGWDWRSAGHSSERTAGLGEEE